ncbi:hypothetical protein BGZ60DRAFT_528280 [Tricladium varicosporioides]|nr:hypothetical protein BGZ60DRAFT_528280 [Hymenoscyphus varicosporioides]
MPIDSENNDQQVPNYSRASPSRRIRFGILLEHSSIIQPSSSVSDSVEWSKNAMNDSDMSNSSVLRSYCPSNPQSSTLRVTATPFQINEGKFRPRSNPSSTVQYMGHTVAANPRNLWYALNDIIYPEGTISEVEELQNILANYNAVDCFPSEISANTPREMWSGKSQRFLLPICTIFENDPGYEPAFDHFYETIPGPKAKSKDVEAWFKTWFEVTNLFENDFGVEAFLRGWGITGGDLRRATNVGLARWFASSNVRGRNRQEYSEEIIHRFYTDVQRARIYDACARGVPGTLERVMSKTKCAPFLFSPNTSQDNYTDSVSRKSKSQSISPKKKNSSLKEEGQGRYDSKSKITGKRTEVGSNETDDINKRISDLSIYDSQEDDEGNENFIDNSQSNHILSSPYPCNGLTTGGGLGNYQLTQLHSHHCQQHDSSHVQTNRFPVTQMATPSPSSTNLLTNRWTGNSQFDLNASPEPPAAYSSLYAQTSCTATSFAQPPLNTKNNNEKLMNKGGKKRKAIYDNSP